MPTKNRFALFAALTIGMATTTTKGHAADPDKTVTTHYVTSARKSVDKVAALVESLQDDIVEELAGEKEKTLFQLADQTQSEIELLDKTLVAQNPTRDAIYKQSNRVDTKIAALAKAISELSPKRPVLARQGERIRVQSVDLHFVLSVGDDTKERQRQVLVRQAKSMESAAKQFVVASEYALLDRPGRAPFMAAVKKFAEQCESFEKLAGDSELDLCKKEFSTLTEGWNEVVRGFLKLSPKEDYHIARLGFRLDGYHLRLFELLKMPGKRPMLTINL